MTKQVLFTLFFAVFLFSCANSTKEHEESSEEKVDSVYIASSDTLSGVYIWFLNSYFDTKEIYRIDKFLEVEAKYPYIEVRQSLNEPVYWLKAGEKYTAINTKSGLLLSHEDSILNSEVSFFRNLSDSLGYQPLSAAAFYSPKEVKERESLFRTNTFHMKSKEEYEKKLVFLENNRNKLSTSFYSLTKQLFAWEYISKLIEVYYSRHSVDDLKDEMRHTIASLAVSNENDSLLFSPSYTLCLSKVYYTLDGSVSFGSGTIEFIEFEELKRKLQQEGTLSDDELNQVTDSIKRDYLLNRIAFNSMKDSIQDSNLLFTADMKAHNLKDVLEGYKGKFVYVDFWASWCAPCRELFPLSQRLHAIYQQEVQFLYISIDDSYEAWQEAAKIENIPVESSYILSRKSSFVKNHKIQTIPRYMLFDRQGQLVDADAMRPDDAEFKEKMTELITERK